MTQEVRHGFRRHLETGHWRSLAADDLVYQVGVAHAVANTDQLRSQQPLSRQTMAAGTVDAEQLSAVFGISLKFQCCFDVGILLGTVDHPDQQHRTGRRSQDDQCGDQTPSAITLFCCS